MNPKIVLTFVAFVLLETSVFAQVEDENGPNDEMSVSMDFTSLLPIVRMIKGQIKEIVIDLAMQVFRFLTAIVQDFKVRLLKRLGKYTLSDAFHLAFDGVVEFVNDSEANGETTETARPTTKDSAAEESNESENEMESRIRANVNPYMWHQN